LWHWNDEDIKAMVRNYFNQIYLDDSNPHVPHTLPNNRFANLYVELLEYMERSCTGCEIKKALFDINAYKAPGPNGYQALFFPKKRLNW